ncbi:hypothetical protein O181_048266 [Austropuccinia psidii MF-1]|uniref:Protein phosphatase n=1 Tax=Austropuccinia psidii MF-1 TaxID=1389203 RepID=A0A9Q3DXP0_9BASI|nr:hypothetical protein [Austropuccinia psidii MF-1]
MVVPNSRRASLLSFVNLKRRHHSALDSNSLRSISTSFRLAPTTNPTNPSTSNANQFHSFTRSNLLVSNNSSSTQPHPNSNLNHQSISFFDPSISSPTINSTDCSNPFNSSIDLLFNPINQSSPSSTQSSTSQPRQSSNLTNTRSNHSQPSSSSSVLSHSNDNDLHHPDQLSNHPTPSNLSITSFTPLNLYGHTLTAQPHQKLKPTNSLSHKKTFFVFRNGASGIPKNRINTLKLKGHHNHQQINQTYNNKNIDHQTNEKIKSKNQLLHQNQFKSVQVGEDAYFLRSDSLGVADGVGGWSGKPGANAGVFSSKLMHHCSIEMSKHEDIDDVHFLSYNSIDPVQVLQHAFERSIHESKLEGLLGSSTALIAILRNDELRIANIGDCCCSIIRGNDFIFRSEEQQHSFNYPVQIGTNSKSTPVKDAQRYNIKVQKDDIVILSSDGLADNLFDEDILEEVLRFTTQTKSDEQAKSDKGIQHKFQPQLVSESLCLKAKTVIDDQQAVTSPFSQRANEEGIHYVGGKNDDISVLVAVVGDQTD